MSMQRRGHKTLHLEPEALDFYGEPQPLQFNDESDSDEAINDGTAPDYVVVTSDSILCVGSKAEAELFRYSCDGPHNDEDSQSFQY